MARKTYTEANLPRVCTVAGMEGTFNLIRKGKATTRVIPVGDHSGSGLIVATEHITMVEVTPAPVAEVTPALSPEIATALQAEVAVAQAAEVSPVAEIVPAPVAEIVPAPVAEIVQAEPVLV